MNSKWIRIVKNSIFISLGLICHHIGLHYDNLVIFPTGFQDTHIINTRKARNIEYIHTCTYIINLFHAMFYMNFRIIDTPWVIYLLCVIDVQKINHRCTPTLKSTKFTLIYILTQYAWVIIIWGLLAK